MASSWDSRNHLRAHFTGKNKAIWRLNDPLSALVDFIESLEAFCDQVIQENEAIANAVRSGNENAASALVGRVMKLSEGQANPKIVMGILLGKLQG